MVAANTVGSRAGAYGTAGRLAAEARLADLRQKLRDALAQKQIRMKELVETCKADRRAVRDHVRAMRARSLRDVKDQIQAARGAAKLTRLTRLAEVRQIAGGPVQHARAAAAVEKAHQGELARLEREERSRRIEIGLAHDRSLAAGALRSALFGKLAPLFEREGRGVATGPGESRAEALLRFAERNPEKVHAVVEPAVHRKVEETKRAVAEAERSVRASGGDVRVGIRPSSAGTREERERQARAGKPGPWPLPGELRIGSVGPAPTGRSGARTDASNDTTRERPPTVAAATESLGDVVREGASERAKPGAPADGIAESGRAAAMARGAESGGKGLRKTAKLAKAAAAKPPKATAMKRPKPTKTSTPSTPKAAKPSAPTERKKGQIPRSGGAGMALADLLQERDEVAAAKTAKSKGGRDKRARTKKVAAKTSSSAPSAPPAPGTGGPPSTSYAAWCELVSHAAAKHGRRIAFGGETHDAWRDGTSAEAFVLTQPTTTQASPAAILRDARSHVAAGAARGGAFEAPLTIGKRSAPYGSPSVSAANGPGVVTSTIADSVRPYKVRASCGHVVVRPMRAATARVAYSPDVLLDAPKGRACDACEAKQKQPAAVLPGPKPNFGAHAPTPAPKKDVKAPELRDTAEIAKRIRADIAQAVRTKKLPKGTYSVRTSKYSQGSSIDVVASKLPFPLLNPAAFHLEKGSSEVSFARDRFSTRYSPQAESVLATLNAIVDAYHWDRSDPVTDYYNERFGRDVKLDTAQEWERVNEAKRAEARALSTPASTPTVGGAAPAGLPSPRRIDVRKSEKPKTTSARAPRAGRVQQTLDTDSPLFAGAPRWVGAPAEGPTKSEGGGSEP